MEDVKGLNCGKCKKNCGGVQASIPCCLYCKHISENIICLKCRGLSNSLGCKFKEVK